MPERLWDAVCHLAATYGVAPDILAVRLTMIGDMHRDEYEQALELAIAQICDGPDAYSPEDAIRIVLVLIDLRHVHEYKVR